MKKPLSSNKAKEILKDGTVHGKPLTPKQERFMGAVAGGNSPAKPKPPSKPRTNLGGNTPPALPQAKQRPRPPAIGERPVMPKTAAKMKKMRG